MNAISSIESTTYSHDRKRFSDGLIDLFFGFMLAFCCLIPEAPLSGQISMALFCIYIFIIIKNRTLYFLKYLAVIAFVSMNILGCYVTEYTNLYLSELSTYSRFSGSLPLLVFSRWMVLPVISLIDHLIGAKVERFQCISTDKSKWIDLFSIVFLGLVLICFSQVVLHPAFLLRMDRFDFSSSIASVGLIGTISGHLSDLSIVPMLSVRHGNRKIGICCLLAYVLYLFWIGTRFGAYFTLTAMLVLTFYDKLQNVSVSLIRRVAYASLAIITVLVFVAVGVRGLTSDSNLQSVDYLLQRTAQQGQLWWRTYDMKEFDTENHEAFLQDIEEQFGAPINVADNVGSSIGIYGVMYRTAPTDLVSLHLSKGSAYAEGGYAAAYYYLGPLGTIGFSIIVGVLISLIVNGFLSALMCGRIIETVIFSRLFGAARGFMGTFIFSGLVSPISIACYVYLIGAYLLRINGAEKTRTLMKNRNKMAV